MTVEPEPVDRAPSPGLPAEVLVDLDAVRHNVRLLKDRVAPAALMVVVKADAYGHGLVPVARAALEAGADALGVAHVHEALALRAAGVEADVLAWLLTPGTDLVPALAQGVELSVAAGWALEEVVAAARAVGRPAGVHLEVDTGMSRGGASPQEWPALLDAVAEQVAAGVVEVRGTWGHFAGSDEAGAPTVAAQLAVFEAALATAREHGVDPGRRHHANSAAALLLPQTRYDLVRVGLAVYGLSPAPALVGAQELGLVPAMTLTARVAHVRRVPAGAGVSYGLTYRTPRASTLALVPVGYGDGLPRHGSWADGRSGRVLLRGAQRPVAGRVCMDQVVLDLGDDDAAPGDVAVLFGTGADGGPTAQDWAEAAGTIAYEIVTRIGPRVPRRHLAGSGGGTRAR